jgi:uncharacterized membrane protein YkoI
LALKPNHCGACFLNMQRPVAGSSILIFAAISLLGGCATALPSKDVFCVQRASVSLKDAVETAEKQGGGRAVDAHFRQDEELGCLTNKPSYYEVTLLSRGALETVDVDARSSQAQMRLRRDESLLKRISKLLDRLVEPAAPDARVAPRVRLSLPAAIEKAEEPNAKAVAAELEQKGGMLGYEVELVENGRLKRAWVAAG